MNEKVLSLGKKCLKLVDSSGKAASFLGGKPLVGVDIAWPEKNGKPLGFIGQLDLSEINSGYEVNWLPSKGRLLFFYDFDEWPWGFDPKDKGGWAVIYENGADGLFEFPLPSKLPEEHLAPGVKYVKADVSVSYPDAQRIDLEAVGLTEDDDDDYYDFVDENYGDLPRHQIDGFPNPIQNDNMEEECQLVSGGVYCGSGEGYRSEEAKELNSQVNDWRLLFQYDSDDDIEAMWGDSGMLYFWVRESDARKCDFTRTWMVLQCC